MKYLFLSTALIPFDNIAALALLTLVVLWTGLRNERKSITQEN